MAERIIIRVELQEEEAREPSVQEVFAHILELFELAEDGSGVLWRFVSASSNSPLTVVAEARSVVPGVAIDAVAKRQAEQLERNLSEMRHGSIPRAWREGRKRSTFQRLLARNSTSIRRTVVQVVGPDESAPTVVEITPDVAVPVVRMLEQHLMPIESLIPPREQMGSIRGRLVEVKGYRGNAAIYVEEQLTGAEVICVLSEAERRQISDQAHFNDVWAGREVIVSGTLIYGQDRNLYRVNARSVRLLDVPTVDLDEIRGYDVTGGLDSVEYIDKLREGTLG